MDKEDSNSTSFEIVDKKAIEQANNGDKSGTLSSVSSPYSVTSPGSLSLSTGNLLSNVGPPSSIPDFTLWTSSSSSGETKPAPITTTEPQQVTLNTNTAVVTAAPIIINQFPTTQFSAAIPPSKGVPQVATTQLKPAQPLEGEPVASSSFLGLVRGALSSQVVTKMVEKAKSSVDSIITTLDPQMSEYIYSGGDLEITVATDEEDIVSGIREAAHSVFGKAWVNGIKLSTVPQKSQTIGIESGLVLAEERIDYSFKFKKTPTIAVESILLKEGNSWFDVSLLLLKDKDLSMQIHTFSQAIPVPVEKFVDKEVADIDVEQKLSEYLKGVPCWQEEVSGVPRRDTVFLAAKVLFKLYKDHLPQSQTK
ncbi:protein PRRC1-like [Euwallacea fornicatus]|uniref:protein PRRC1-like n=1 Tax=Euwallacea fornicatus TaxID=995702 RepID=UPI00338DA288